MTGLLVLDASAAVTWLVGSDERGLAAARRMAGTGLVAPDLVGYEVRVFDQIAGEYGPFAAECGITSVRAIPISALDGDGLVTPSARLPWYEGPTVMQYLETVETGEGEATIRTKIVRGSPA